VDILLCTNNCPNKLLLESGFVPQAVLVVV